MTVFQCPSYSAQHVDDQYIYYDFDFKNIILSIGILLSGMNSLIQYYGVSGTMNGPTIRRLSKVFGRAMGILTILFILAGCASYYGLNTKESLNTDLFIFREPLHDS